MSSAPTFLLGIWGQLFSFTSSRIDPAAWFLDTESGVDGLGRSMNSKLGREGGAFLNPWRHALGKPWIDPEVIGSTPSPFTNALRNLVIGVPGVKNLLVIFLMSMQRSPSCMKKRRALAQNWSIQWTAMWCHSTHPTVACQDVNYPRDSWEVESRLEQG